MEYTFGSKFCLGLGLKLSLCLRSRVSAVDYVCGVDYV